MNNDHLRFVDHAYAHTSFKEQGATNDRQIFAVSLTGAMIVNRESTYVALTRAKDNTEIVTSDLERLAKNAGRDVSKTTALDTSKHVLSIEEVVARNRAEPSGREHEAATQQPRERAKERGQDRGLGWSF